MQVSLLQTDFIGSALPPVTVFSYVLGLNMSLWVRSLFHKIALLVSHAHWHSISQIY